ncbi:hypothetical protein D3C85_1389870 [compost metagenome]
MWASRAVLATPPLVTMPATTTLEMPARRSTQSNCVLKKAEYATFQTDTSTRPSSSATLACPAEPATKSPLPRNGRNCLRCGEIMGSPCASGHSVNRLAATKPPCALSARATGATRAGKARACGLTAPPRS